MRRLLKLSSASAFLLLRWAGSFALWTLWLLLATLLLGQFWIAASHEVALPGLARHLLERRLSHPEFRVELGVVRLDIEGNVVVQDFSLYLPAFDDPVLRGRLARTRLDPAATLAGIPAAGELHLTGIELLLPAPISPSGRAEPWISNLDAVVEIQRHVVVLRSLSATCATASLSASGSVNRDAWRQARRATPAELAAKATAALRLIATRFPSLQALVDARLAVVLEPSSTQGAVADLRFSASELRLTQPVVLKTGRIEASTRFPLAGAAPGDVELRLALDSLRHPQVVLGPLVARVRARVVPARIQVDPLDADLTLSSAEARGVRLSPVTAHLEPGPLPVVRASLATAVAGSFLSARGSFNTATREGRVDFDARVTPEAVELASAVAGKDFKRFVALETEGRASGSARAGPGGRLIEAEAWVEAERLTAYKVPIDHAQGRLQFDGARFTASEALVITGESFARGSYTMHLPTRDYRFLLEGALRPAAINGWLKEWWPNLWKSFDFPASPPQATIDLQGRWGANGSTKVFLSAETGRARIRGLDAVAVRTRLFIRPTLVHALSADIDRTEGSARGWFIRRSDPVTNAWTSLDFEGDGNLDLIPCAQLLPPQGPELMAPYVFSKAPKVHAWGHIDAPAGATPSTHQIEVRLSSEGPSTLHGFTVQDLSLSGRSTGGRQELDWGKARVAGGKLEATGTSWTEGERRLLRFEANLKEAFLGQVISQVEAYTLLKKKSPQTPKATAADRMSEARLDLGLKAEGPLKEPFGLRGSGHAELTGAELGQLKLLGLLSSLLRFTALRFTTAKSDFTLDGARVSFPNLRVSGRNSAINAEGTYSLDSKQLDVRAMVLPFEESQGLLKNTVGLVLAPLSYALEVRLGGSLAEPKWSFAYSPFRAERTEAPTSAPPPSPAPIPPSAPSTPAP